MTKKILIIASYAPSLITFRFHLIKALISAGYEVEACAPVDEDPACNDVITQLKQINVKFHPIYLIRTGTNPLSDLRTLYGLTKLISRNKFTTILSYTMKPVVYASLAAKIVGNVKIYSMITGVGFIFSREGIKGQLIKKLTVFLLRSAITVNQKVFFQNNDNIDEFNQLQILKNTQQAVLINGSGVNLTEFQVAPYPTELAFILVARLLINKGIREYIAAAQMVKMKYPHIKFYLVGWIDDNPNSISQNELQTWIKSSDIEYLGRLNDVRPAIARSSVFVLPSYSEGTPRSVLEAMAMSRPIITTNVPGCKETVIHGENGFLVPKQDEKALAEAMLNFINDPNLVSSMGQKSRQIAVDKYDVHQVNQVILNTMEGDH